jgi:hypothetical protein
MSSTLHPRPFGPSSDEEDRMAGFYFRLELEDGTLADPPTHCNTAVPNWQVGDTIPLGADRMLRVTETPLRTMIWC